MTRRPYIAGLTLRLVAINTAGLLLVPVAVTLVLWQLDASLYPYWYDAEFLRGRAEAVERFDRGEITEDELFELYGEDDSAALLARNVAVALGMALVLSIGTSWLITRRLVRLSGQAKSGPAEGSELPGPFAVEGRDEIADLARALNQMRGRVEELLGEARAQAEARRVWVAQVSHDFRTPLSGLIATLEGARRRVASLDAESAAPLDEHLVRALEDAARLRELAEDILEAVRLEAVAEVPTETVPTPELADGIARRFESQCEAAGLALEVRLDVDAPAVKGNGRLLQRALENLLRNAVQNAASRVVFELGSTADAAVFAVEDDGDGALCRGDETPLDELLDPDRRVGDGGIGLTVVARVARVHGAACVVARASSGGARVRLEVPARPA